MKFSIIIPTWGPRSTDLLQRCCESIVQHTDLTDTEVIVSANGCPITTDIYVAQLQDRYGEHFVLVRDDQQLGYSKAINRGVEESSGEYLIFLNNDTMIQGGNWIDLLYEPFKNDPSVGVTGPMKSLSPETGRLFLIFFCVMVKRQVFEYLGGLDAKTFTLGWGEDTDFCHKVEDMCKRRIVQVPFDPQTPAELQRSPDNPNIGAGGFPIWHEGGRSIAQLGKEKGDELINKNSDILKVLYGQKIPHIDWASRIEGFMSEEELKWLAMEAKKCKVVVEYGSYFGRSTRALADNLPVDGKLFAIDHWNGTEGDALHNDAKLLDGDYAYFQFTKNLWKHIDTGRVIPLRMHGKNAAKVLLDLGIKADLVFLDGPHGRGETRAAIESFLPLVSPTGIIAGHDYMHEDGMYPDVAVEVLDIFTYSVGRPDNTHIWYSDSKPEIKAMKLPVYDCFTMFNELDMLEVRLNTLNDVVDRFVISEAPTTHQGHPKPLYFQENLARFSKFLHKISYICIPFHDIPKGDEIWGRERQQRDNVMFGLPKEGDGIVIISDIDEIPNPEAIKRYQENIIEKDSLLRHSVMALDMDFFYYNLHNKSEHTWQEGKIVSLETLRKMSPCEVRYTKDSILPNGGWHLSYFGGVEAIKHKLHNFAHWEYNKPEFTDLEMIKRKVENHEDLFGRPDEQYQLNSVEFGKGLYPKYVEEHVGEFKQKGWLR